MKARVLGWAQVRKCQAGQAWGAGRAGLLYVLVRQEQGHKVVQCGREKATMEWILETLRTPAPSTVRMGGGRGRGSLGGWRWENQCEHPGRPFHQD